MQLFGRLPVICGNIEGFNISALGSYRNSRICSSAFANVKPKYFYLESK